MFQTLKFLSGAIALLLPFLTPAVFAQTSPGTITGLVTATDGSAVTDAEVLLATLHRRTSTDEGGRFRFADVPPGDYLLEAKSPRFGSAVVRVTVTANGDAGVEMTVALVSHEDDIVVTGSVPRSQLELAQPTSVLTGEELAFRVQPSLGETLAQEPGVASTFFGAGSSRPVIRGLGGDRIRTLQGGLGSGDVSTTSPDHAVAADPAAAERIEVLRGPATLLYGSSAIGGVVNVIDGRIPDVRSDLSLGGFVELRGGSVDGERTGMINLDGGSERWAWHVDAVWRETNDYDIPGFADRESDQRGEEEHEEEEHGEEENPFGTLPNSDLETVAGSFGVTRFSGDSGFLGISVGGYDSEYGIPGGGHGQEEEEPGEEEHEGDDEHGEDIRVDLDRQRFDLRGEIARPFGAFQGLKTRFGIVDYQHAELEGASREIGTRFFNDSWEGRLELVQKPRGPLSGSVGLQVRSQDLEAVGAEAFIPATDLTSYGVFAFEEIERGNLRYQLGARFESQDTDAAGGLPSRSFDGLSGSFGIVWQPKDGYSVGVSLARSTKLPNAEELYSDGPHFATRAFEIGDPNLDEETSLGFDLSLRKKGGRLRGELSFFRNDFDDFIYGAFTGEEEDGLEVLQFTQADAEFTGGELKAFVELWQSGSRHVDLKLTGDMVRAELSATGEPLPRIPPRRYGAGLHFHSSKWHAFAEARRVGEQDRVAANETSTDGYTFVNVGLSYRLIVGDNVYDLRLRGTNLTDEEGRNHVSFLKDTVPLPGRNVSLAVRWSF